MLRVRAISVRALSNASAVIRRRPRLSIAAAALLALAGAAAVWALPRSAPAPAPAPRAILVSTEPEPRPVRVVTFAEGCTNARCHADMTGRAVVHAPIAADACNVCHAPDSGGHVYPLLRDKAATCEACHDAGSHGLFQHKAMSEEACLACHDPHASSSRALLIADSASQTCSKCHPPAQGHVRHKPYVSEQCDACHDPHGADNKSLLLGGPGADHCGRCHLPEVLATQTAAHSHRDAEGSCLACHAPHAADHKSLLLAQPRDLCVVCHSDVCETVAGAAVSHDPVLKGEQCVTCHEPHASGHPRMLRASQSDLCLSCHDKPVIAADGRNIPELATSLASQPLVHGAISAGDCSACHTVHGGTHSRLLRDLNPAVPLGPAETRNFALCFSCHDPRLAEAGAATQFRDGARNLHEVHLRSTERPHSCASCHSIHAGNLPRLIAKTVRFEGSDWAMPIGFSLTAEGGRCGPGCHEPLEYNRRSQNGGVK
ncbi:hypothetical protein PHYC_03804 [Phycisphaerales bacterium]|nr:hypothetical protein PHYC_03804 [Phycisphaerales bacterium]